MINNNGEVVGITVGGKASKAEDGTLITQGINWFIPTGDALSFLSLNI